MDEFATFFHTGEWATILRRTYGYPSRARYYRFDDTGEVSLPLSELPRRLGLFRNLFSTPGGFGGPVGGDLTLHRGYYGPILEDLERLCSTGATVHVVGNPIRRFCGAEDHLAEAFRERKQRHRCFESKTSTHLLSLGEGFDVIWRKRFDAKARNQYRKAEKSGVTVASSQSLDDLRTFFDIYVQSTKRWVLRSAAREFTVFESALAVAPANVLVWLARSQSSEPLAGAVCLYFNGYVHLWASALHKEYAALRPNDLLYGEIIRHACSQGYRVFDFGSSDGLPNVHAFKQQFGPAVVDVSHFVIAHPLAVAVRRLQSRLTISRGSAMKESMG